MANRRFFGGLGALGAAALGIFGAAHGSQPQTPTVQNPVQRAPQAVPVQQDQKAFNELKEKARKYYDGLHIGSDQISSALAQHRFWSGVPRTYADYFLIDDKDWDLLGVACLSRIYADNKEAIEKGQRNKGTLIDANEGIKAFIAGQSNDVRSFDALDAYPQALLEKKAQLLLNRFYARFNKKGAELPGGPKSLRGFVDSLHGALLQNGNDGPKAAAELQYYIAMYVAAGGKEGVERHAIFKNLPEFKEAIQTNFIDKITDKDKKKNIEKKWTDVLKLIDDNAKLHKNGNKLSSEDLLREVMAEPGGFVFGVGSGTLVRRGDGGFTCIAGTKEEWGQMLAMSAKYLHDRGDPWRTRMRVEGSTEFCTNGRGIARSNSWRMEETGHSHAFVNSEVSFDIIQNYRFNLQRGYAVARTVRCDAPTAATGHKARVQYMRKKNGDLITVPVVERIEQTEQGVIKHYLKDANGNILKFPVPETVEQAMWDNHKTTETDTPEPDGPMLKHCDTQARLGKGLPSERDKSFISSWATGGQNQGNFCYCGSFRHIDPETGRIPDEHAGETTLFSKNEMECTPKGWTGPHLNFELICKARESFEDGLYGDETPEQRSGRILASIAAQSGDVGEFMSDPVNSRGFLPLAQAEANFKAKTCTSIAQDLKNDLGKFPFGGNISPSYNSAPGL